MAYPHSFVKLTFGGILQGTEEIWNCGIHLIGKDVNPQQDTIDNLTESEVQGVVSAITTFYEGTAQATPNLMKLNWVKFAAIGVNGKYLGEAREIIIAPAVSGSSTDGFIPSTAVVYSLMSDKFKDPGKYNRFYLPTTPPTAANTFQLDSSNRLQRSVSCKNLLTAINTALNSGESDLEVGVVSQRVSSYLPVTSVRVGNTIDSQRRRRNRLYETYSETAL